MDNVFVNSDFLRYLLTGAAGALVLLGVALVGMTGLKLTVKQAQQARFYFTQYYPTVRAQVDQRTDTLPTAADKLLDKALRADWDAIISTFFVSVVDAAYQRFALSVPIPAPAPELTLAREAVPAAELKTYAASAGPKYDAVPVDHDPLWDVDQRGTPPPTPESVG